MNFDNYKCDGQMSIFDVIDGERKPFKIDKPIRLIELFAGIGSQALSLKKLDPPMGFELYRAVEFDKYPVKSYNAIHGTDIEPMDITKIHAEDLGVVDTWKYCYIMSYSFPCQDLSVAGLGKGMQKGSGTRSGLLWEVERLLDEMSERPQVLLMENVPQVHGKKNVEDFQKWLKFLESKGYSNYWQDMNAKEYGVAQNRNRCIMVSILGNYSYEFPKTIPLKHRMKDYLEDEVDEKYYITNDRAKELIDKLIEGGKILTDRQTDRLTTSVQLNQEQKKLHQLSRQSRGTSNDLHSKETVLLKSQGTEIERFTDCACTLMARDYKGLGNQVGNGAIEWQRLDT